MSRLGSTIERLSLLNSQNWVLLNYVDIISIYKDPEYNVFWSSCDNDGMPRVLGPFQTPDVAHQEANDMLRYTF